MTGTRIDLDTDDGTLDLHVFRPAAGAGPWPAVILYMDAFGVREELAGMAGRLASAGYVVALPNLYHRTPFAPFDMARVVAGGPERDRFKAMIATIDRAKVMADTRAVIAALEAMPDVRQGALGAVGYCMGGGYALLAAGSFPDRFAVAASFHGGGLATDKPDSPHTIAGQLRARVYIGAAEVDPAFPAEQQARLAQALTDAGVRHTIEIYPGARHGFAVTGHAVYDHEASERHWTRLETLLGETLQASPPGRYGP